MTTERWKTSNTAVYNLGYHMIWCTKYRRRVLNEPIHIRLKELLHEKANDLDCIIESMEIMADHVHLFTRTKPIHSPHFVIGQFKGYSSRHLRLEFSSLKSRLPSLWTRSYYVESVGHISDEVVQKYIANQKNR